MHDGTRRTRSSPGRVDLLEWPLVGRLLRWRHARTSLQLVLLVAAAAVVLHGILGPEIASGNLATVLTWVHYRGLLVVALLAAGNFFCAGCPFVLVRDWGRRLHAPTRLWPARLRGKWIAIALFVAVLFAYERFDLWALPRGTAYLVLAYFAAALAIDTVFRGASFCKHVCPIGQFNFVASTISPLELQIREPAACQACRTSDCIVGRRSPGPPPQSRSAQDSRVPQLPQAPRKVVQRGCELGLYLPAKVGNIDCTFCLDCVQACPHDNIAIAVRTPGIELADTRRRSGIGRLVNRPDIGILSVLFVFGAMVNAFAMVGPVQRVERWLAATLGTTSESLVLGSLFVLGLGVAPLVLLGTAAGVTRVLAGGGFRSAARTGSGLRTARAVQYRGQTPVARLHTSQILRSSDGPDAASPARVALRYAHALVPFGFGMWLAHYGFHFLTGALTVVPVTQSAAVDLMGWAALGDPLWRWAGMRPGAVFPIQLGCIVLGTIGSLGVVHDISRRDYPQRPARAAASWDVVVLLLAATAIWILFQPMEMRGMGFGG